ncbi:transglutaminase [Parazoarcus communis]|uniref:Transglutaminase n=1 Tax=Parazoarcus communis TaxID=41977 RepID=A0A2U8H287_9RHOO|nr:transglutaminase [Parazoarcus communis]AWI79758.1 transglutaminase [Parazoarcus communis]
MDFKSKYTRVWKHLFWASAFLTVILAGSLAPHFKDSAELVRMRNALLLQSESAVYDWTPATIPQGFALETAPPLPLYDEAVSVNALRVSNDDWATALNIGRHLLASAGPRGRPIQSDLADTYRRIMASSEGYCGDYADSFTGLANAAGLFSRPWAFSFDGFGGRGHIFNEIWDSQRSRWIMIDVFNNFYVTDAAGEPLSALMLREALQRDTPDLKLVAVNPDAPPGFKFEPKALEYYRRGLPEWYMWWGNNVFEYDDSTLVRVLGNTHRALEQLGGVVAGVHPQIRILAYRDNQPQREAMERLRLRLIAILFSGAVSFVLLLLWMWSRRRATRAFA